MNTDMVMRMVLAVVLGLTIGISGYHRRKARDAGETIPRSREDRGLIFLRVSFGLPLLIVLVISLVRPALIDWSRLHLPDGVRWAGALVAVLCVPLIYGVVASLGPNISETVLTKREHELVTDGPYRWVRHPLYTTGLLILASAAVMTDNGLLGGLTIIAGLAIRRVVIPAEEAALIEKFGDRYRSYMRHTGCLLPRLRTEI